MPDIILGELLQQTKKRLKDAGIDSPGMDADFLIEHALNLSRTELFVQHGRLLTSEEINRVQSLIDRRLNHEPVARIIGERHFWGMPFRLNEATLEPRPDSETLIDAARKFADKDRAIRILDLGTGTGCLLLALLSIFPNATGLGVDLVPRAIDMARMNAKWLHLSDRSRFKVNNWLEGIEEHFDIIISNPPYVRSGEIPSLMPEVRDYDPLTALDGGKDGLDVYRFLIPQLPKFLKPNGVAVLEVGQGQAKFVSPLFRQANFKNIATYCDFGGIERCILGVAAFP